MKIKTGLSDLPATIRLADPPAPVQPPLPPPVPPHPLDDNAQNALRHALNLSALVYDDFAHVMVQLQFTGFREPRFFSGRYGGQCLCGSKDGIAYIAFRGTSNSLDWMMNLLMVPAYWPPRHFGFEKTWRHLRNRIEAWLESTGATELVLTGHSLGGAMAHLAAMHLAVRYRIRNVFTFGAPKACYLGTAARYQQTPILGDATCKLGAVTWGAIHQRDIVANVPFALLGYRDVGHVIYIDGENGVHYGEAAAKQRSTDSLRDTDLLLKFLDVESAAIAGSGAKPGSPAALRHALASVCQFSPPLKFVVTVPAVYLLTVSYLLRSGLDHMSSNYERVLLPAFSHRPRRQVPGRIGTVFRVLRLVAVSVGFLLLFLWGLKWVWALIRISLTPQA